MELVNGQVQGTVTRREVLKRGASGAAALALAGAVLVGGFASPADAATGTSHSPEIVSAAPNDGSRTRVMTTTALVNFRDQPSHLGNILMVLPAGTEVIASATVVNGFRAVIYDRIHGWVYAAYLE